VWQHEAVLDWAPDAVPAPTETLDARLLAGVRAALAADPIVPTLADGHPNHVREITPDGIWVETERSRRLGRPPQLVPARMIQIAWEYLSAHGEQATPFYSARTASTSSAQASSARC
jgi:hypothetical protein